MFLSSMLYAIVGYTQKHSLNIKFYVEEPLINQILEKDNHNFIRSYNWANKLQNHSNENANTLIKSESSVLTRHFVSIIWKTKQSEN